MLLPSISLLKHPFPDVRRTVQDRHACRLTRVEKTNALDIHKIEFLQIQRDAWSATLDLRLQLINVLRSKLPAQTNPYLSLASNRSDLQRHGSPVLKNSGTNAIAEPSQSLARMEVRVVGSP